jgi:hypothetical protein
MTPETVASMDTRLLTYEELGLALNITPASAKRLAIRRKWAKTIGNDGKSRVAVPVERLTVTPPSVTPIAGDDTSDDTRDAAGDITGDNGDTVVAVLTRHIERLEGQIESLIKRLVTAEADRDSERQRANELATEAVTVPVLRETIEALKMALDAEKQRSADARQERDRWQQFATAPRGFFRWLKRG